MTIAVTTPTGHPDRTSGGFCARPACDRACCCATRTAVATARLLAEDWTGRQVQAVHGPADLTWHEVAAALSTATGVPIEAQRISDDDERVALRASGMGEVAVEGIMGMAAGKSDGFVPEQPRSILTTTPSSLSGWAITHLRPVL